MDDWTYVDNLGRKIPVSEEELRQKVTQGEITYQTPVYRQGMFEWQPCGQIRSDLFQPAAPPSPEAQIYAAPQSSQFISPGYYGAVRRTTDPLAIASLVCSLVGAVLLMCVPFLAVAGAIPAVICGHMSRAKIRKYPDQLEGDGMALAGIIIGYLTGAIGLLVLIFFGVMMTISILESGV